MADPRRPRLRLKDTGYHMRLLFAVLAPIVLIFWASWGYRRVEGWSWPDAFYMTVITLSTVGFGEVHPLSPAGRVLTGALILGGIGLIGFCGSVIIEAVFKHHFRSILENRQMKKAIQRLRNHIIVCGAGRMGRLIQDELCRNERPFVIIERDPETAEQLIAQGCLVVQGDASEEEVLQEAGIEHATSLVAALANDADNTFLTITARGMSPDLMIIVRAEDEGNEAKFMRAGASRVVSPFTAGATQIVRMLTQPAVMKLVELASGEQAVRLEVSQIKLDADSPHIGHTLAEAHARQTFGGIVIAIHRESGQTSFYPSPDTPLKAGDDLFLVGASETDAG